MLWFAWNVVIAAQAEHVLVIGTGEQSGLYHQAGRAICKLLKKASQDVQCITQASNGSINNINDLRDKKIDIAVTQSDWQHHAYYGLDVFVEQGEFKTLRSLFSLHNELITILVQANSPIQNINDLKGKRLNIGLQGSGAWATMLALIKAKGWNSNSFNPLLTSASLQQLPALCEAKLDAIAFITGHPNGHIKKSLQLCDLRLLSLSDYAVKRLIDNNKYYSKGMIDTRLYPKQAEKIQSFGVSSTFVTTNEQNDTAIYYWVKALFDNLDLFKKLHPAFNHLEASKMIQHNLTAPLHQGAIKYYTEQGWMQ